MSCKYCDIKMRPLDEDTKVLKGESWKDGLVYEGGYIGPSHDDKFRMIVNYDAGFACTEVPDIKYCPFCGEKLKLPAESLIKDEKIRKAVRAWAEAIGREKLLVIKLGGRLEISDGSPHLIYISFHGDEETLNGLDDRTYYTIDELCGGEEE